MATYLSDYSLSDCLFFTMYIKKISEEPIGGFNPQTPLGYATDDNCLRLLWTSFLGLSVHVESCVIKSFLSICVIKIINIRLCYIGNQCNQ